MFQLSSVTPDGARSGDDWTLSAFYCGRWCGLGVWCGSSLEVTRCVDGIIAISRVARTGTLPLLETETVPQLGQIAAAGFQHVGGKDGTGNFLAGREADLVVLALEGVGIKLLTPSCAQDGFAVFDHRYADNLAVFIQLDGSISRLEIAEDPEAELGRV